MNILVILIWISLLLQIISISTPNWSTSEYKQQIFGKNMTIKTNTGLWKVCVNSETKGILNLENSGCFDTNTKGQKDLDIVTSDDKNKSFVKTPIELQLELQLKLVKLFTIIGVLLLILGILLVYKPFIKYKYILLIVLGLSFLSNLIAIIIWLSKIQKKMKMPKLKSGYSMILYIIGSLMTITCIILNEMKLI